MSNIIGVRENTKRKTIVVFPTRSIWLIWTQNNKNTAFANVPKIILETYLGVNLAHQMEASATQQPVKGGRTDEAALYVE